MISAINIAMHIRQDDVDQRDDADWQEDVSSVRMTAALTARDQHSRVTVEEVARKFKCGLETAKKTLKVTTQAGVRQALHPFTQMLSSRSPEPEQKTTEFNIPYGCVAVKGKVSEWKLVCEFVY